MLKLAEHLKRHAAMPDLAPQEPSFDPEKFRTAVHYVCAAAPNPRDLGKTKLNKILFYADRSAYLTLGQPITGETYIKHQYGPVSSHLDQALADLEAARLVAISTASGYHAYTGQPFHQAHYVALLNPILSGFTAEEISILGEVTRAICENHSARSISHASHDVVWEAAQIGEEIPYYTAFVAALAEIGPDDLAWAESVLAERPSA